MLWTNAGKWLIVSLAVLTLPTKTLRHELTLCLDRAKAAIVRPIEEWAESEIILPDGPFKGERYRHARHPVSRPWFQAIDSRRWSRFAATGPTQNGKTLMGYVIPTLYHLFEIGETVIIGIPMMDMANDKWQQDFLPVIQSSRYADLMPDRGEGSKGGMIKRSITFKNGAALRFMSGGGGDKKRAGYTSRVLAVTETDGMDEPGDTSREADKIEQLEGRTRAYGRTDKRVYLECTTSIEAGRIWQEVKRGTDSRLSRPCLHCGAYVTPEREHLLGWESAESEEQAAQEAFWSCPACGEAWTDAERRKAAESAVMVHRGQEVTPDGKITGDPPQTQTLGFRWSAIDNPFATAGTLGAEEWLARRARDRENAEKKMRQFIFTLPVEPPEVDLTPLDPLEVQARQTGLRKRELPADCVGIAVQVDTGKRRLHWQANAVRPDGSQAIVEYGVQPVESDRLGVHRGLVAALSALSTYLERGWPLPTGASLGPSQVWIDSAYFEHTDAVYQFCARMNAGIGPGKERYRPTKGQGEGQRAGRYRRASSDVVYEGREFHISRPRRDGRIIKGVLLVVVNSDHWKSEFHQRLAMPLSENGSYPPGAITLYETADPNEHSDYAQQATAERQVETMGVISYLRERRENHHLDTGYGATCAGDFILDLARGVKQRGGNRIPAPGERMSLKGAAKRT